MPRKLWIEMSALEKKFLELSWKLHPDKFVGTSEQEQELSLRRSSELNDAYRVLRDPVARVEYLLELEGMRKEGEHKQQAPPELLEEVFELNESLDELRRKRIFRRNWGKLIRICKRQPNNGTPRLTPRRAKRTEKQFSCG